MPMSTSQTRVLVVADEPLARERLRTLLQEEPGFEVVGEASDGTAGAESIMALAPDLVFLDVQMPGADGFDIIDAIGPEKMPFVVFCTAYDRYALKAFDVHAVDYLLSRSTASGSSRPSAARSCSWSAPRAATSSAG